MVSPEDEPDIRRAISVKLRDGDRTAVGADADAAAALAAAAVVGGVVPGVSVTTTEGKQGVKEAVKFGMWDGVLARCLLNIWGVILFLRVGWMVGYAGIGLSVFVILLAVSVTFISTLSLSAICTNGKVEGGGAYYMISRALGPRFGGSIGCLFFCANAVAVSLYLIGFAETLQEQGLELVSEEFDLRLIAFVSLVLLFILCMVGVDWVIKVQLVLLGVLVVSISSFIIGCFLAPSDSSTEAFLGIFGEIEANTNVSAVGIADEPIVTPDEGGLRNWGPDFDGDKENFPAAAEALLLRDGTVGIAQVFSVFFPAVTGIMAGANISGDLKDPSTAIPTGTLAAVGVSTVIYVFLAILIGVSAARTVVLPDGTYGGLLHDSVLMARLSFWPPLVYVGIYAATLSSAIASLVGAPRILQAVARDNLFPGLDFFAKGHGAAQEPIRGYVLSSIVAIACIAIGNLNAIGESPLAGRCVGFAAIIANAALRHTAPLITNFFMATYALVNYATFLAAESKAPGWRPTFKHYNKWLSLGGAVACFAIMMLLDVVMGIVTVIVGGLLFKYIELRASHRQDLGNWGAAEEGQWFVNAVTSLKRLNAARGHVKNWRPQLLVLSGSPEERSGLEACALHLMRKAHGLTILADIIEAPLDDAAARVEYAEHRGQMRAHAGEAGVAAFEHCVIAPNFRSGASLLLQLSGLGNLRPNTVLMGYKRDWAVADDAQVDDYMATIRDCFDMKHGMVIVSDHDAYDRMTQRVALAEMEVGHGSGAAAAAEAAAAGNWGAGGDSESGSGAPKRRRRANPVKTYSVRVPSTLTSRAALDPSAMKTIDVWWLVEDGGLTVLLPHLLMRSRWFRHTCRLRLMCVAPPGEKLEQELQRNKKLMAGYRIEMEVVGVPEETREPSEETSAAFERLGVEEADTAPFSAVTRSYLHYSDLIRTHSSDAFLVFVSLPVPKANMPSRLYMAWLDAMSQRLLPRPAVTGAVKQVVVLLRGNKEPVLTFKS